MKIGFIGAGAVGQMHLTYWSKLDDCRIVALADLRPELREQVASRFEIPNTYNSHKELLENADVDAVIVVTRRHNTAAVVFDCLNAGKHVFSEKPMAKTLDQAKKLADTAAAKNVVYAVGYQRRHDAGTQIARQYFAGLMETQELGELSFVRAWNFTGQDRTMDDSSLMTKEERTEGLQWAQTPEWIPVDLQSSYDRFINVFCHDANILRFFIGENPEVKYANLGHGKGQVIVMEYKKFPVAFEGGFNELNNWNQRGIWDEGLELFFENGRMLLKLSPPLVHSLCSQAIVTRNNRDSEVLSHGTGHLSAFQLQASSFLADITYGRKPLASGEDAVEDLALIESIWRTYLNPVTRKGIAAAV